MTDRELFIKALDALEWNLPVIQDYGDKEQLNIQYNAITALRNRLEQPEPVTGNLLKDAYNAMVEKKTRSQKLREAGFTRRPKGWEKEKDDQEPVAWANREELGNIKNFDANIYGNGGFDDAVPLYTTPPQRKPLTDEEILDCTIAAERNFYNHMRSVRGQQLSQRDQLDWWIARAIEAAHGIKP